MGVRDNDHEFPQTNEIEHSIGPRISTSPKHDEFKRNYRQTQSTSEKEREKIIKSS